MPSGPLTTHFLNPRLLKWCGCDIFATMHYAAIIPVSEMVKSMDLTRFPTKYCFIDLHWCENAFNQKMGTVEVFRLKLMTEILQG